MYIPLQYMWPLAWDRFWPCSIMWTNLVGAHSIMLLSKYQDSRTCDRQKIYLFMLSQYKPMCPLQRGQFLPRDIIWTNLEEVHKVMLHTIYWGFKSCGFRKQECVMFSLYTKKMIRKFWSWRDISITSNATCQKIVPNNIIFVYTPLWQVLCTAAFQIFSRLRFLSYLFTYPM